MSENPRISIVHDPSLDDVDRAFVEQTLERTLLKMDKLLRNEHQLKAVYKQVQKDGLRHKTEIRLSIDGSGKSYHATAADWKVRLATTEACSILEREIMRATQQ